MKNLTKKNFSCIFKESQEDGFATVINEDGVAKLIKDVFRTMGKRANVARNFIYSNILFVRNLLFFYNLKFENEKNNKQKMLKRLTLFQITWVLSHCDYSMWLYIIGSVC